MRSDDRRGGLVIVGWFLGAVALLAMAGLLGWWYFYWNFTPPWAAPPCSKEACPDRYRASSYCSRRAAAGGRRLAPGACP